MYRRLRNIPPRINLRALLQNTTLNGVWKDVKEALAGTERDFTTGTLSKAIFILALPMVLEMVMESVFAVVDIFFVSKLGSEAVATVGITESLMTIIYSLAIGLSAATTALVSRRIGEKNPEGAAIAAVQAIIAGVGVSLVISIPGIMLAPDILRLMGASTEITSKYFMYTTIMLGSNVIIMLLFIINSVFRSAGDAAISMRVLWLGNIINIFLDPCLIFGVGPFPEMGITGAAVATNIGRGIAILYQFYLLFRGNKRVSLHLRHLRFDLECYGSTFSHFFGRDRPITDRHLELDRHGPDHLRLWQPSDGGLYHRYPYHYLCVAALMGFEQCCSNPGGAELGRQTA